MNVLVGSNFVGSEAFVSDCGSSLSALDLRTGRLLYTYSGWCPPYLGILYLELIVLGLAGTVSSIASTKSSLLASTSRDRYFLLHRTHTESEKPEVLAKGWTKTIPTCVVWDGRLPEIAGDEDEGIVDAIWNGIAEVIEEDDESSGGDGNNIQKKKRKT